MTSMSTYTCSVVTAAVLLGGCYYYYHYWWSGREEEKTVVDHPREKDDDDDEKTPLWKEKHTEPSRAKSLIARFETLEAQNNAQPESATEKKTRQPTQATLTTTAQQRCPVCRKRISPTESASMQYEDLQLHQKCFVCRECDSNLGEDPSFIRRYSCNGKVQFLCRPCQSPSALHKKQVTLSKQAGQRVEIQSHEQGDTQQVLQEIGDDLEQAVYFMTPRCTVCGGTEFDRTSDHNTASPDGTGSPTRVVVLGRTIYHSFCFDTGRPIAGVPKGPKLPPSFCAKYLPQQIILKLVVVLLEKPPSPFHDTQTKKKRRRNTRRSDDNRRTLTTLYFVWKDRETQAVQLRQEKKDASTVVAPFSLDEQAPANPNYAGASEEEKRKRKQPVPTVRIPHNLQRQLQMELVTPGGAEVAPRCPVMPEPVTVVEQSQNRSSEADAAKECTSILTAKLSYLKFGLQYCLAMTIPCRYTTLGVNETGVAMKEPSSFLQLELQEAKLAVTIQGDV